MATATKIIPLKIKRVGNKR